MSVNLDKNRTQILSAWNNVVDDKSNTDWALFGYEAQTNDLKVISTGDGGLDELSEELNSGKIMYAFVRVNDSKTSLTKYLLINWQGEGAPTNRKGSCANHIRDISKILTGAHLTINARTEDDVETDRIMEKISAVGSAYSFKEPRMHHEENRGPIGTNYSRVIPAKEINVKDRDNFWKKEEEEERRRVELERERRQQELVRTEKERRIREEKEHHERERRITANELKSPTVNVGPEKSTPKPLSPIKTQLSPTRTMTQAEEMRQQRNNEAKQLIGSRVGTAKAIFTQNSASGQMHNPKTAAPIKPVRNSIAQRINSLNNQSPTGDNNGVFTKNNDEEILESIAPKSISPISETEPFSVQHATLTTSLHEQTSPKHNENTIANTTEIVSETNGKTVNQEQSQKLQTEQYEDDGADYSTIKRSPYTKTNSNNSQVTTPVETEPPQQFYNQVNTEHSNKKANVAEQNDTISEDDIIYQDVLSDGGLKARALYDYQAADESEITFDPGDIITHIDQIDEGWWQGLGPDGAYGLFPANYVELIH